MRLRGMDRSAVARVDEDVGPLGVDGTGRAGDQPVEQAAEEHEERREQRQDDRCRDEATRSTPELGDGDVHAFTPAPVVASIGSMRSTRRAETSALRMPSTNSSTDQNTTAPVWKLSGMLPRRWDASGA